MVQVKIIFYILSTFFRFEGGAIAAENTTVTVYPKQNRIEILHQNLFTVIEHESERKNVKQQWKTLISTKESKMPWVSELDSIPSKDIMITEVEGLYQVKLIVKYANPKDIEAFSIWYNADRNDYSINFVPSENLKTKDGQLDEIYWVFSGDSAFSFTLSPFESMPAKFQELKLPIEQLVH